MKLHPRERITKEADIKIQKDVLDVAKEHELTFIELVQILSGIIQSYAKFALREERHPDEPDKPAGLA